MAPLRRADRPQPLHQRLVRPPGLNREARQLVAVVPAVEGAVLVDGPGEEAAPERAVGHEPDAQFRAGREHLALRLPPPQRVLALDRGDGLDGVRATDRRRPGLGQAEVPDLALRDQLPDRARDLLDRRVGIDAVLVEQVDRVDSEARQGGVGGLPDELGPARERGPAVGVDFPELRGHDDLITDGGERVAHQLLVRERAVDLRGVEERHPEVHRVPDQGNRLVPGHGGAAVIAQAHAAEPERGHLQPAGPQRPVLQCLIHARHRTTIQREGKLQKLPKPPRSRGRGARARASRPRRCGRCRSRSR